MAGAPEGNKNATKQKRMITDALKRAVAQDPEALRDACIAVLKKASEGDLAAFNTIADRIDGKPAQTNILQGDEDNPIAVTEIIRTVVKATDSNG